ncbi:hypothetical protein EXS62_01155 [Candidatus Kaiserbacteria bacterium]|nr:hypothetical protein [Candidatus Kaiserbacteria bacterium]
MPQSGALCGMAPPLDISLRGNVQAFELKHGNLHTAFMLESGMQITIEEIRMQGNCEGVFEAARFRYGNKYYWAPTGELAKYCLAVTT